MFQSTLAQDPKRAPTILAATPNRQAAVTGTNASRCELRPVHSEEHTAPLHGTPPTHRETTQKSRNRCKGRENRNRSQTNTKRFEYKRSIRAVIHQDKCFCRIEQQAVLHSHSTEYHPITSLSHPLDLLAVKQLNSELTLSLHLTSSIFSTNPLSTYNCDPPMRLTTRC